MDMFHIRIYQFYRIEIILHIIYYQNFYYNLVKFNINTIKHNIYFLEKNIFYF